MVGLVCGDSPREAKEEWEAVGGLDVERCGRPGSLDRLCQVQFERAEDGFRFDKKADVGMARRKRKNGCQLDRDAGVIRTRAKLQQLHL
jgi:hypothetical protein